MDATTQSTVATVGATVVKNLLVGLGGTLAAHGVINANGTETFVSLGMVAAGALWSLWNSFGRAIMLAQLEVLKAKSLAQAAKLQQHDIAPPTAAQIADHSEVLSTADVAKITAKLALVLVLGTVLYAPPALAQQLRTDSADTVTAGSAKGIAKIGDVIGRVKQFTIDDLTAAAADADNQVPPDPAGECWRALIPAVQAQQSPLPAGLGLAQAMQKARNLQRRVRAGVPDDIKAKCAIVLWDAESAMLKLGIRLSPIPIPGLP